MAPRLPQLYNANKPGSKFRIVMRIGEKVQESASGGRVDAMKYKWRLHNSHFLLWRLQSSNVCSVIPG